MDESKLRAMLLHQININLRLQEFMYDMMKNLQDAKAREDAFRLMNEVGNRNKEMLTLLTEKKGLLG